MQGDIGELVAEERHVAPVRGCLPAVEQPGLGQHQRPSARGTEQGAAGVHPPDPVEQAAVERAQALHVVEHDVRDEDDVRTLHLGDRVLGENADAGDRARAGPGQR